MFNITTKFYDTAAPETPDLATAMASGGIKVDAGAESPIQPAAPVTPGAPSQQATPEPATPAPTPAEGETPTPAPAEPAKPEPAPPPAAPEPPAPVAQDWREVLKSQQPDTILKELGFDEQVLKLAKEIDPKAVEIAQRLKDVDPKIIGLIDHWKLKGDVKSYLEALSTDYSQMAPEDVMRHQLRKDYPELSKEDFEILYNDRVTDRYKIDPNLYSEDEVRRGKVLLGADAQAIRKNLVQSQNDYLLPKAPEPSAAQAPESPEAIEQRRVQAEEKYRSEIINEPYTKDALSNKRILIGSGDEAYNYELNADQMQFIVQGMAQQAVAGSAGLNKQQEWLIGAMASDPDFLNKLATHYKAMGAKSVNDQLENAKKDVGDLSKGEPQPSSMAAGMAKGGRIVTT